MFIWTCSTPAGQAPTGFANLMDPSTPAPRQLPDDEQLTGNLTVLVAGALRTRDLFVRPDWVPANVEVVGDLVQNASVCTVRLSAGRSTAVGILSVCVAPPSRHGSIAKRCSTCVRTIRCCATIPKKV